MIRTACKFTFLSLAVLTAVGCGGPRPVILDLTGVEPELRYDHLAKVLRAAVLRNGLAGPELLKKHAAALDEQLKLLAVTGPTATPELLPTDEDRLAYWYNARAAWSLRLLLADDFPRQVWREQFQGHPFPLDGRTMSLAQIDETLAHEPDFRVAAAAPGATTHCARLPAEPFAAASIRRQIDERFAEFLDDPIRFVIDVRRKRVYVPAALWSLRDRILREHRSRYGVEEATLTTALLPHVSGSALRRLQDAIGYRIAAAPSRKLATAAEED